MRNLFCFLFALLLCIAPAWATEPENGDFETGDLTGWTADENYGCTGNADLCLVEVSEDAAESGTYGLNTAVNSTGQPGAHEWVSAESDDVSVPFGAVTVHVAFDVMVDDKWPEPADPPTGPSNCTFFVVQDHAWIGKLFMRDGLTRELPDNEDHKDLPGNEWAEFTFGSDLDGYDPIYVMAFAEHYLGDDGDMTCYWDNIVISFGF